MPTRRELLRQAAAAAATLALAAPGVGATEAFEIVDTHQHLWDLEKFRLPWLDKAGPLLKRNYLTADYRTAIEGTGITRAVYMEIEVTPEQFDAEADWVVELCQGGSSPTVAAVIGGRPGAEGFKTYINRFKGSAIVKGVRSPFPKDGASNAAFVDDVKRLGDLGFAYDLLADPTQLMETTKLVDAARETRFILDHCGNASTAFYKLGAGGAMVRRRGAWEEGLAALAQRPNVICKISGVAEAGAAEDATIENVAPVVNRCLDRFGPERVIFAGNWPVCLKSITLARWVEMLKQITVARGAAFQGKLFRDNATRFYGLHDSNKRREPGP
jgi:predicted TIM-barrel fold metal-dependent hydrolase